MSDTGLVVAAEPGVNLGFGVGVFSRVGVGVALDFGDCHVCLWSNLVPWRLRFVHFAARDYEEWRLACPHDAQPAIHAAWSLMVV